MQRGSTLALLLRPTVDSQVLHLLLRAGFNTRNDPWLVHNASQLSGALRGDCEGRVCGLMEAQRHTVPSLAHLCRSHIRQVLTQACGGRGILAIIQSLPLPPLLREYVAFKDELGVG